MNLFPTNCTHATQVIGTVTEGIITLRDEYTEYVLSLKISLDLVFF